MPDIERGTISLYPTRIVINGYRERIAQIEGSLNVYNEVTHSYDFQAYIKDEEKEMIYLPNSFSTKELKSYFPSYKILDYRNQIDSALNAYKNRLPIKMKFDCRDVIQEKSMEFLNKKRGRNQSRYFQRYLCLKTGQGKTFCAVKYIVDNNDRPIIFVDQEALAEQWKKRIVEYTDTEESEIYYISGSRSVNKLMEMDDNELFKIKFFLCCYRTLTLNIKNNSSSKEVSNLLNHIKVNLKIYDEAHVEYMSIFKMDMITNIRSLYLSATPKRSDPKEDKVYQKIFKYVDKFFSYMADESLKDTENYHNIIMYKWNSKPSMKDEMDCSTKYGFSMAKYCNYLEISKYDIFESLIYDILFKTVLKNRKKKKVAILFGTNSLLDIFYNNLSQYVIDMKYKLVIGKFNGTTKKEDKMKILEESDIIITTDKSFSKGMDVKNLQVLINTVPFSSDTKLIQVVGRLRPLKNKEVFFIDINDVGFSAIQNQLRSKRSKVYNKLAYQLFELNKTN